MDAGKDLDGGKKFPQNLNDEKALSQAPNVKPPRKILYSFAGFVMNLRLVLKILKVARTSSTP